MNLTEAQKSELKQLATPIMEWLRLNFHPHVSVIIDSEVTELMEGVTTVARTDRSQE